MKTTYHGYYGAKNSGDDAFVEVAAWGATKYWGSNNNLFFSRQLPSIKTHATCLSPHQNHWMFLRAVGNVINSDIFVSAGGSTFHSALKVTDLRTYAKYKKSLFKGKIGAIGISLGPFTNTSAEQSTIDYLRKLDFLALRDKQSFDLASGYNLPYKPVEAFDLAALLPKIYARPSKSRQAIPNSKKIIGVSICNYESYKSNGNIQAETKRNNYILELLSKLKGSDDVVFRFFIFNGNEAIGDAKLTHATISQLNLDNRLNYEVIPYLGNVEHTWCRIEECDVVISTRLHASIFACFCDVPFFLLEYHRKCSDFLNDIGQDDRYRLHDADRDVDEIVSEINNILSGEQPSVKPLYVNEAETKALYNFTKTINNEA